MGTVSTRGQVGKVGCPIPSFVIRKSVDVLITPKCAEKTAGGSWLGMKEIRIEGVFQLAGNFNISTRRRAEREGGARRVDQEVWQEPEAPPPAARTL